MPAANPLNQNALPIQGPDPTGNDGYPLAVVGAPGGDPVNVAVTSSVPSSTVVTDIEDGAGDSIMNATLDAAQVSVRGERWNTGNPETVETGDAGSESRITNSVGLLTITRMMARRKLDSNFSYPVDVVGLPNDLNQVEDGDFLQAASALLLYTPNRSNSANALYNLQRGVEIFKTVAAAAAGNTALWTPAAGKRFRLMRYMVAVTGDASFAAAANLVVSLFDGAAGATGQVHDIYVPLAAAIVPGASYISPWVDLGNGFLSAAAGNVLNANLSAALVTGLVRVIACGTEE